VILTAEEIVTEEVIRSDPNRTLIPGFIVDAVCHVPYCSHPSYTQGYYDRDNAFYLEWDKISQDRQAIENWLDEWVFGVKDRQEYWQKLGLETHARLQVEAQMSIPVNYGKY
jgi:glutaconate CoA-transferase subunit A